MKVTYMYSSEIINLLFTKSSTCCLPENHFSSLAANSKDAFDYSAKVIIREFKCKFLLCLYLTDMRTHRVQLTTTVATALFRALGGTTDPEVG